MFTIRPGEPVRDNVAGNFTLANSDIIKIRNRDHSTACVFLTPEHDACSIYKWRPLECRVLECWRPEFLRRIYKHNRLSRKDLLLPEKAWLWDLAAEHQRRCDYYQVAKLAKNWLKNQKQIYAKALMAIIRYDASLRYTFCNEGKMAPEILDFIFGQPLSLTIKRFGICLERTRGNNYRLL